MRNLPSPDAKSAVDPLFSASAATRWRLKRLAERALKDRVPRIGRDGQEVAHYKYRVCMCHRGTDGLPPSIRRNKALTKARFTGLQTCGSVWHCPLCAAAIANERR